jgi:hypothetical protein
LIVVRRGAQATAAGHDRISKGASLRSYGHSWIVRYIQPAIVPTDHHTQPDISPSLDWLRSADTRTSTLTLAARRFGITLWKAKSSFTCYRQPRATTEPSKPGEQPHRTASRTINSADEELSRRCCAGLVPHRSRRFSSLMSHPALACACT